MIHHIKEANTFCISSGNMWLPGSYADRRTARYAFRFPDEELHKLQTTINDREPDMEKRVITFEDLQNLARYLKKQRVTQPSDTKEGEG